VGDQTSLSGEEEGAIEKVQDDYSVDSHGFLTISDNILTVGELARGEEQAGLPHPHPRGLLEGAGGG
jgi:hypothetical protein